MGGPYIGIADSLLCEGLAERDDSIASIKYEELLSSSRATGSLVFPIDPVFADLMYLD